MNKILFLTVFAVMAALGTKGAWAQSAGPFPDQMTNGYFGPAGSVTPNTGTGEFEIYKSVNALLGTSYTNNTQLDSMEYTGSTSTWVQAGNGDYSVIGVGAAATNTLEVYNAATPGTLISPLGTGFTGVPGGSTGTGSASSPYIGTSSVFPVGTNFGFAISSAYNSAYNIGINGSASSVDTWYSNPAYNTTSNPSVNDAYDHMLTYNLSALNGTTMYILDPNTGLTSAITLENPYLLAFEDQPINFANGGQSDMDYNDLTVLVNGVAPVPEPVTVALFGIGLLAMAGYAMRRKLSFISRLAFIG
jgi:hypothetical protein